MVNLWKTKTLEFVNNAHNLFSANRVIRFGFAVFNVRGNPSRLKAVIPVMVLIGRTFETPYEKETITPVNTVASGKMAERTMSTI